VAVNPLPEEPVGRTRLGRTAQPIQRLGRTIKEPVFYIQQEKSVFLLESRWAPDPSHPSIRVLTTGLLPLIMWAGREADHLVKECVELYLYFLKGLYDMMLN